MTNTFWKIFPTALCALLLTACEHVTIIEENEKASENGNLVIRISGIESYNDPTRSLLDVSEVCTRLGFALFQDGTKVKYSNQKQKDSNFGSVSFSVEPGDYQLLIVGHSGEGNPTISTPEKIQFKNLTASGGTGYTDTFYHLEDITVGTDTKLGEYILQRATALVQIVSTDPKPNNVRKVHFRYTGGSGAFNAYTGYGCVKSTQAVIVETGAADDGQTMTFNLYTFPREDSESISLDINIIDGNEQTVLERHLEGLTVKRNNINRYSGQLFTGGTTVVTPTPGTDTPSTPAISNPQSTSIKIETDWGAINEHSF